MLNDQVSFDWINVSAEPRGLGAQSVQDMPLKFVTLCHFWYNVAAGFVFTTVKVLVLSRGHGSTATGHLPSLNCVSNLYFKRSITERPVSSVYNHGHVMSRAVRVSSGV